MGWSIGYDEKWKRDIGYGVSCVCDHPYCNKIIDRGLSYVCGSEPYGGEHGCGLYFCTEHKEANEIEGQFVELCSHCNDGDVTEFKPKPDTQEWRDWKRTDDSWAQWREENPKLAAAL